MYSQLSACIKTAFDIPNSLEKGIMAAQVPLEVINLYKFIISIDQNDWYR